MMKRQGYSEEQRTAEVMFPPRGVPHAVTKRVVVCVKHKSVALLMPVAINPHKYKHTH